MQVYLEIARHWNETGTRIQIATKGEDPLLSVSIPLEEAVRILKARIGSVSMVFSNKEFERRVDDAIEYILTNMGKDTIPYSHKLPQAGG
jgi:hypothetical protein